MSADRVYVLCSRYSKACAEFMNVVTNNGIDIVVPVYIDNPAARKIVAESPLDIHTVPCVIGSVNGYMATYEGRDAFEWLNEVAQMYARDPSPSDKIPAPDAEPDRLNAHVDHKIDAKSVAEKMRMEREMDDDLISDRRRRVDESRFDQNY